MLRILANILNTETQQRDRRKFLKWWICLLPWLGWCFQECLHMSKLTKLYTLIMCSFLDISYTSVKLGGGMYLTTGIFLHVIPNKYLLNLVFSESSHEKHGLSQQRGLLISWTENLSTVLEEHISFGITKNLVQWAENGESVWCWCWRQEKRKDKIYLGYFDYDGQQERL